MTPRKPSPGANAPPLARERGFARRNTEVRSGNDVLPHESLTRAAAKTNAEAIFWQSVRGRRFYGLKFKRQRPFGRYFLDFFCEELNLAIELDGAGHLEPETIDYDTERTTFLQSKGLTIVRIANDDLVDHTRIVFVRLERIVDELKRLRNAR